MIQTRLVQKRPNETQTTNHLRTSFPKKSKHLNACLSTFLELLLNFFEFFNAKFYEAGNGISKLLVANELTIAFIASPSAVIPLQTHTRNN